MYAPCNYCENENCSPLPSKSDHCSLEELNTRIAVRFFVKKSKRFDFLKQQMQHRLQQLTMKSEPSPECLTYLGLVPRAKKTRERDQRQEERRTEFEFPKPKVYECSYCTKIFFHRLLLRRHMMRHVNKVHRCTKCDRGFSTKISRKRHEITCRR